MPQVKIKIFLFFITISTIQYSLNAQCWSEVWSDEFNGTSLNTSDWNYDIGTGCPGLCGWGNNEKEYYTNDPQNISVSGGLLTITARYSPNHLGSGYNFTSAKIHTRNKQYWKYGKFEARMKLPSGVGTWPAFWMLPQSSPYGGWPTSGEIDIMEYRGDLTTKIDGTVHYGNPTPNNQWDGTPYTLSSGDFVNSFHIFTVEWDNNQIRWYVDNVLFKTETKTPNTLNPASNNAVVWPWDQDFYLILNLALGGWYSGNPSDFAIYGGNNGWTANLEVDYVRVYTDLSGGALTGTIAGKSSVLPNETNLNYSIPSTGGATYVWSVPTGATITSGQGSNSINVDWGNVSGSVDIAKTIGCGTANYSLPITLMPISCGAMLEDFENIRFTNYSFVNGQFTQKVLNPASIPENTSPFCAQYIRNPSEQYDVILVQNPNIGNADLIETGSKRFMFDVYSNGAGRDVEITLEDNNIATPTNYPLGRHSTYRATTTKVNEWETLTFNYVTSPDGPLPGANVNQFVILFTPGNYNGNTFYFDNLLLDETPLVPTINGASTVCPNQTGVSFNVVNTSGYTYNWSVPGDATITSGQNSNQINVDFGVPGDISVIPSNASSCVGPSGTKIITSGPPTPPAITGLATVCSNQTNVTYSVSATAGSTYAWTVPPDATILNGQGTNSISVNFGTNSGNISVDKTYTDNCPMTNSSKAISNTTCTSVLDNNISINTTSIFPNPASDILSVELGDKFTSENISVKIMDNTGKLISEILYKNGSEISIPVSTLNAGYYLMQLSDEEYSIVKSFVKK